MRFKGLTHLLSARHFPSIAAALLFVGLGDSVSGPYGALYLTDKAHLSPVGLGTLITVRAASAILIGTAFGRWFDRRPSIVPLFLALTGLILGNALIAFTTNYWALFAIVSLPLGTAAAGFPQLFALARRHLDAHDPMVAERGVSFLRALYSMAWATGPAIGAAIIIPYDFRGLFLSTALCGGLAMAVSAASGIRAPGIAVPSIIRSVSRWQAVRSASFAALALTLFATAMFVGSIALSISVPHDMGGSRQDVGHAYSLCAFIEVLVMGAFVAWPVNVRNPFWMSAGFVAFALYFLVVAIWPTVTVVLAAQAIRAVAIGLVGCLGISYAQTILEGRAGAGAALFANSITAGSLLSGLATGAWAEAFGYESMFGACAVLSGLGLLALRLQPRIAAPPSPQPSQHAA